MSDYMPRITIKEEKVSVVKKVEKGIKYDQGKPDLTLLPRSAKEEIARVLMFGASKYGRNNYKKGMNWSRVLAAAERHLTSFSDGEDLDEETKLTHLAHAGACICMLLHYYHTKTGNDNRVEIEEK